MTRYAGLGAEDATAAAPAPRTAHTSAIVLSRVIPWLPLVWVVALSLTLNTWALSVAGYGNTYYAAAVRSMTMSWKNFYFGAFDPGGFITVDKPPVFLWVGALSARIFGYSQWSILLPSAIAGAASVALLWFIVRRYFGVAAATISGMALALSPISVAVNRLNLPEPFLILALLGAAGAVLQSIESRRWWAWTALAGCLVGVAFNTKMLVAWIPVPALALAIVVAVPAISRVSVRRVLMQLAMFGAVALVVSGSWMLVVDAWPASDRPYIGGSTDNTVLDLALGYNGVGRVDGDGQAGPGSPGRGTTQPFRPPAGARGIPAPPQGGGGAAGGFRGAGGIVAGIPGALRMFDAANGGQIGWLLPFAIGGGLVVLWIQRRDPVRRAFAVLFLGWIALYGGVFSYAEGIFHSYYTSVMAPGVAALVGVGAVGLADAVRRDWRWLWAVVGVIGVTVWAQLDIAGRTPDYYGWVRPLTVTLALSGLGLTVALASRHRAVIAGIAMSVAGLLLLPAAWSVSASSNASLNATLPQAGPQQGASGQTFGSGAFDDGTAELAAWLDAHGDVGTTWQLVVPSSQNGSRLIAEYGLSVMSLGGFSGRDNTISVAGFAGRVASGDVRYVLLAQGGPGGAPGARTPPVPGFGDGGIRPGGPQTLNNAGAAGTSAVLAAVQQACTVVSDPSLPAPYRGVLYDCAGRAAALSGPAP